MATSEATHSALLAPDILEKCGLAKDVTCTICMCNYDDPHSLPCSHSFCRDCIMECISHNSECPVCRRPVWKRMVQKNVTLGSIVRSFQALEQTLELLRKGKATVGKAAPPQRSPGKMYRLSPLTKEQARREAPSPRKGEASSPMSSPSPASPASQLSQLSQRAQQMLSQQRQRQQQQQQQQRLRDEDEDDDGVVDTAEAQALLDESRAMFLMPDDEVEARGGANNNGNAASPKLAGGGGGGMREVVEDSSDEEDVRPLAVPDSPLLPMSQMPNEVGRRTRRQMAAKKERAIERWRSQQQSQDTENEPPVASFDVTEEEEEEAAGEVEESIVVPTVPTQFVEDMSTQDIERVEAEMARVREEIAALEDADAVPEPSTPPPKPAAAAAARKTRGSSGKKKRCKPKPAAAVTDDDVVVAETPPQRPRVVPNNRVHAPSSRKRPSPTSAERSKRAKKAALVTKTTSAMARRRAPLVAPVVIACSGLTKAQRKQLRHAVRDMGAEYSSELTERVTHLVTSADGDGLVRRTIKYFKGILRGCWIVSMDWVDACCSEGEWKAADAFEVRGDTFAVGGAHEARRRPRRRGLFHKESVFCYGTYTAPNPHNEEVRALVELGGGKVVTQLPMGKVHTARVLCDPNLPPDELHALTAQTQRTPVALTWVLDSISSNQLLPVGEYELHPLASA